MNRTKKTLANAIAQSVAILLQSLFALVVTREIISHIGSDYNGINSTATQILTVLTLLEGGFTLASLVTLYKPYGDNDYSKLNQYLSLSQEKFNKIGILYLVVGIIISLSYAPFMKTDADLFTVISVMVLSVISSSFSILYVSKYRLIYQVSQSEYIIYIIQAAVNIIMYLTEIIVIRKTESIVGARACVCLFQVIQGLIIGIAAKKKFPHISYNETHDGISINGTGDVFISKISGFIYTSSTVLFISSFVSTVLTSVYAVYDSVLNLVGNYINVCLTAPRNALGQLFHEGNEVDYVKLNNVFNEYEYISVVAISFLYSTTFALIIPFVRLYTSEIADINYIDRKFAVLLILISVTQMIHIPSGTCIEVSGSFKAMKVIQTLTAIMLAVFSIIGALKFGVYGIILAKLLTNFVLAAVEIFYARNRILKSSILVFMKYSFPNIALATVISIVEFFMLEQLQVDIFRFLGTAILLSVINAAILLIFIRLVHRQLIQSVFQRFRELWKRPIN